MPARKRRKYRKQSLRLGLKGSIKRKKSKRELRRFTFLLSLFVLFLLLVSFIHLSTKYWSNKSKLSIVIDSHEEVVVATYDPILDEITNVHIPKNTQVVVARDLGTWKLGSVWQLGENESLDGQLMAETITRFFKLPVYVWADEGALGFTSNSPVPVLKSVVYPYKSSLKLGDRVKIGLFCLRVTNPKIHNIDLSETSYLRKEVLVGGEDGFLLTGIQPESLMLVFSDSAISKLKTRVSIVDRTGDPKVSNDVGEILQVLGAKVTSVVKEDVSSFDCEVLGRDKKVTKKIIDVLGCENSDILTSESFDIEVHLGEEFAKRF